MRSVKLTGRAATCPPDVLDSFRLLMKLDSSSRSASLAWLSAAIATAIAFGIVFRFYNLGHKVYWFDETMTSLRISGWNQATWVATALDGQPQSVGAFVATYQYPDPDLPWRETLDALATHPEHSPLYYLGVRLWSHFVPNTVGFLRQLSAWIGLLVLPLTYWLAIELFEKPRVAQIALGLAAISPVNVHYAQEAREYSLWTVAILLGSATLLRAIGPERSNFSRRSGQTDGFNGWWLAYGASVALLLYAHPFSAFVLLAHGLYVLFIAYGCRQWQKLMAYIGASVLGLLAFCPWLWIVWQNFDEFLSNTAHTSQQMKTPLPLYWGLNLSRIFFDVNQGTSPLSPTLYIFLWLTVAAIVTLWWFERRSAAVFLILLMGTISLGLMVPDILTGGRRSHNIRYFLPCAIGVQLAASAWIERHLVSRRVSASSLKRWKRGTIALFVCGALSIAVSSQNENWWTKSASKSRHHPEIARIANAARAGEFEGNTAGTPQKIAIVSNEMSGQILSLSHLLDPQIDFILVPEGQTPEIPAGYDRVFIYRSSDALHEALSARGFSIERVMSWLREAVPNGS